MIYIGIGATQAQKIPFEVLKYSIFKNTALDAGAYCVLNLGELTIEEKTFPTKQVYEAYCRKVGQQHTPFSFQRFLFALYFSESARPEDLFLYLDSDMLVLSDINSLNGELTDGQTVKSASVESLWGRRPQNSVCLSNHAGIGEISGDFCKFVLEELSYEEVFYKTYDGSLLSSNWNSLEYLDTTTKLIHYTDMDTQPWLRGGNANAGIWYSYLKSWGNSDNRNMELLVQHCSEKNIRPGLEEIAKSRVNWPSESAKASLIDFFYVPPHRLQGLRKLMPNVLVALVYRFKMLRSNNRPNGV
jgi:hypothetical protein